MEKVTMIHIYEMDSGRGDIYYEVYNILIDEETESFISTLENKEKLETYLDNLMSDGIDFVLHTDENGDYFYDEQQ
jgi:hypothetical protein